MMEEVIEDTKENSTDEDINQLLDIDNDWDEDILFDNVRLISKWLTGEILNPRSKYKKVIGYWEITDDEEKDYFNIIFEDYNIEKIKGYIKDKGLEPFIKKKVATKNKKATAKKDEDIRVQSICDHVNNNTELGKKIKEEHKEICDTKILNFEKVGGLGDHFDIKINYIDLTKKNCEEKGTYTYHENINESTKPWENSVEFYNGPAEKFSISKKYLKIWYDENVNNNEIKTKYNLPDIPTFENWLNGSPYCMLNPKIDYSKVLKSTFKELYNGDSMCSYKKCNTDIDYRIKVNKQFKKKFNEEDKKLLIKEVQEKYTEVLNQKECWLQTTGNPQTNKFSFKWYKKIEPKKIIKVEIIDNPDILFKFTLEDNTSFNGHMRWGKGCGFSCFRIDFK